ncbi:MAG TPA: hypothetical protein VMG12_34645 [Polyangiaceae bacterium]|nr:hypothetical protein [Polyangiaceae bacterium]
MFRESGIVAVDRLSAREQALDEVHRLVSVEWSAARSGREPLRLSSTFLLRRGDGGLRVVVYLNHHDVRALLSGTNQRSS